MAAAYGNLGIDYRHQGDLERAVEAYGKSLEHSTRIDDKHCAARQHYNLGRLYRERGQAQARVHYRHAQAFCELVGDSLHAQLAAQELDKLGEEEPAGA